MKTRKGIDKKLDDAWSELVKLEAGMECEVCGKKDRLNSHHIYSRSKRSVRWDVLNGVCLCVGCHTFNSNFSAHKTPTEFTYWLHETYGDEYMEELKTKAHKTVKWFKHEKEELLQELRDKIKAHESK